MSWLSQLNRQIYEAGVDSQHFKDIREAALESTKAAVRRLSIKCAQGSASSSASKTSQKSKKAKNGRVSPEMRYMYRLGLDTLCSKIISIMLLSITLKTTAFCRKLCSRNSIMLDWSWLYLMPFSIHAVDKKSILESQRHNISLQQLQLYEQ